MNPRTSEYYNFWGQAHSPPAPAIQEIEAGDEQPHVQAEGIINGIPFGMAMPKKVDKWWGYELHYKNDEMYCMKWLHLESGGATSMHYHVGKHETLLVVSGTLTVKTVFDGQTKWRRMTAGQALVVAPGFAHSLIAAEGPVDLIEASTTDYADDSVRLRKVEGL